MGASNLWGVVNLVLIADAFREGYLSLTPDRLRHTNPDPVLCLIILLVMPPFALWAVTYSIKRWKADPLPRPSWNRSPLGWWRDPLQALFVLTCIAAATAIGSAVRRPTFGSVGFWTLGVYACFAIGLFVGQILVYRIYRQRIAPTA
jgi:hypothetical protein